MVGFCLGEAAARISLDIANLAGKGEPIDLAVLDELEREFSEMETETVATHRYTPLRSVATIMADIRRSTMSALRPEDV